MEQTIETLAQYLKGRVIGNGATVIRDVNEIAAVQAGELTFAEDAGRLARALATPASGVIVSADVTELGGKSGIRVQNPRLAFALMVELFHPAVAITPGVHPTAVLGRGVYLGEQVAIRAYVVLGDDVRIGQHTVIESGVHVGDGTTIGESCYIAPNVVIYRQAVIGSRVRIHGGCIIGADGFGYVFHEGHYVKIPQVGNVVIEDDVELGANVCVDRATLGSTVIRRGTKIDNLVQIAHNDHIGEHVIMAGQVGLAGSVHVGSYAAFGGKAGVVDHVTIGDGAQIGAASVVTKSIPAKERVWGFPARSVQETTHEMAALTRLPELLKRVADMLRRLTALEAKSSEHRAPRGTKPS